VLGVLPGIVGLWQATEAIKWCTGLGRTLAGRLLLYDALEASVREVTVPRDPSCPVCGTAAAAAAAAAARAAGPTAADRPSVPLELDPAALKARLEAGDRPVLLDVREAWEHRIAALPEARLVPLGTLAEAAATLDPHAEYVVYCHHGGRSAMAVQWLRTQGFARTTNLTGGIDAWSLTVDPGVARY
jgi:adenylyltransferase/sulfurtransferase